MAKRDTPPSFDVQSGLKTDYFLILKGEDIHQYQFKVLDRLKTIEEVIQVQTIEANDLPSKRNLIF